MLENHLKSEINGNREHLHLHVLLPGHQNDQEVRMPQKSISQSTGEYFTKKRNFCQGPRQFLP